MKVLLIEDSPDIQRVVARILRRMDECDIWVADNADLAMQYLKDAAMGRSFDLVISDWNLHGSLTGGDVLAWIRLHMSHLVDRFMFFASDLDADEEGVAYVAKPSPPRAIQQMIEAVLGTHRV